MKALAEALGRVDRALARVERWLAGGLFLAMVLVVATSVIHRVFSREEGRLSTLLLGLLKRLGVEADPAVVHGTGSLAINLSLGALAATMAARTLKPDGAARALAGVAALIWAGGVGLVAAILALFPNGLVFGPAVALACMLWVGFLGASIATHEKRHLALEVADKIWPAPAQRWVQGIAGLLTAILCAFLTALTAISLSAHHATWTINPLAGRLLPTEIPNWTVFLVLPYTFAVMTMRFAGAGVSRLAGLPPRPGAAVLPGVSDVEPAQADSSTDDSAPSTVEAAR